MPIKFCTKVETGIVMRNPRKSQKIFGRPMAHFRVDGHIYVHNCSCKLLIEGGPFNLEFLSISVTLPS